MCVCVYVLSKRINISSDFLRPGKGIPLVCWSTTTVTKFTGVLRAHGSTVPAAPPIKLPIPNPNPNPKTHLNPNPIFNPNPNPKNKIKEKRHRNIGQHRVIFITYFPKGRGWVYQRPISETGSFSYWIHAVARRLSKLQGNPSAWALNARGWGSKNLRISTVRDRPQLLRITNRKS